MVFVRRCCKHGPEKELSFLDRMIDNLTLKLDEIDAATLGTPITMNEVQEVLEKSPEPRPPALTLCHTSYTGPFRAPQQSPLRK